MPHFSVSRFTVLPLEIVDAIAYELAALQPIGPPSILLPLLYTCRNIYYTLAPCVNSGLWSRIFRQKFDSQAVQRRVFSPTPHQLVAQLQRYCQAMQILRLFAHIDASDELDDDRDQSLEDALMTAVIMMLENDGKNARQLCEWAHVDVFAKNLVRYTMFREMHSNNGWPVENMRNACAVSLMWMLTSEESLKNETLEERRHISSVLLPFITLPYRYSTCEAPPQHFELPFPPTLPTLPTTIQTAHGPYPVWPPPDRFRMEVHYSSRPIFNVPLIAPAAKLLFFVRQELTPLLTPKHCARNRAERLAQGITTVGPTAEDIDEFNWGWSVRPPQGVRVSPSPLRSHTDMRGGKNGGDDQPSWSWGSGDSNHWFSEDGAEEERLEEFCDRPSPEGSRSLSVLTSRASDPHGSEPSPSSRWLGKAPHAPLGCSGSRKWDADWWRLRLCGDPRTTRTRVPYGKMFEPGCLDGLWHGKFLSPAEQQLQELLETPFYSSQYLNEENLRFLVQPFYIRMREAHAVIGSASANIDLGRRVDDNENMNNAWFDGPSGSTNFCVRQSVDGEHFDGDDFDPEVVEIEVTDNAGTQRRAIFPCRKRAHENPGLGNASDPTSGNDVDSETWMGYQHDDRECSACQSRLRVGRQLQREREQRIHEAIFASAGLGLEDYESEYETVSVHSYDTRLDEVEPFQGEYTTAEGVTYPALPRTLDRKKLAHGTCDGVREVYVVGSTDQRHSEAWGGYEFYGRVRDWDGLIGVLRKPKRGEEEWDNERGYMFFYGYLVGGENWVGNWRFAAMDGSSIGYEGAFVMSRRYD